MSTVTSAYAAPANPLDILARLRDEQDATIQDGLDTGALTADEAKTTKKSQDAIDTMAGKANADGTFTSKELRDVQQAIRQLGQQVYTLSHNKAVLQKGPDDVLKSMRESQAQLIQKGVDSGALTEDEAKRLRLAQDALARKEDQAKADGSISLTEMQAIQQARKAAARDIYALAHNKAVTSKPPVDALTKLRATQEAEITAGIESGDITPDEAKWLNAYQASIAKMEERARADGKVTAKELQTIKSARDYQQQQIYTLSTNKAVVAKPSQTAAPSLDKQA